MQSFALSKPSGANKALDDAIEKFQKAITRMVGSYATYEDGVWRQFLPPNTSVFRTKRNCIERIQVESGCVCVKSGKEFKLISGGEVLDIKPETNYEIRAYNSGAHIAIKFMC